LGSTVDIVRPEWIITDTCCLKEFDCLSVQTEQLDFTAPFQIKVNKQQQLDALVVYKQNIHNTHRDDDTHSSSNHYSFAHTLPSYLCCVCLGLF
jgi:hypothetical protein